MDGAISEEKQKGTVDGIGILRQNSNISAVYTHYVGEKTNATYQKACLDINHIGFRIGVTDLVDDRIESLSDGCVGLPVPVKQQRKHDKRI